MDLANIVEQDSGEYELRDPVDRAPLGVIFTLAGPEHPVRQKITLQAARDLRRKVQQAGKLVFDDPEAEREQELDYLVAATLGWKNLSVDGQSVEFSAAAARSLYQASRFAWVRRQVRRALDEAEVFIVSSSKG